MTPKASRAKPPNEQYGGMIRLTDTWPKGDADGDGWGWNFNRLTLCEKAPPWPWKMGMFTLW